MEIKFKFKLGDRVRTLFEEEGIVEMLGVDDGGNKYFIKTRKQSSWFKEDEISMDTDFS